MTSGRTGAPMPAPVDVVSGHPAPDGGVAALALPTAAEADRSMVSVPLYRARRGYRVALISSAPVPAPQPRPTVLARTLALAHRMQAMLDDRRAKNRADLAAKLGFSRARITQIMELLWLAPDIQEEILFSVSATGRDVITTRDVKGIVQVMNWAQQRRLWQDMRAAQVES